MDFLVDDEAGYRELRLALMGAGTLEPITRPGLAPVAMERELRADQYGIRTFLLVDAVPLKFEIVREARIAFELPTRTDRVHGVYTLTRIDLAASKLLANSDRWVDNSTFARDIIDLAMLDLSPRLLARALRKAEAAYGPAAQTDAGRALRVLRERPGRLVSCMEALSITLPPAFVQQRLRSLARRLAAVEGTRRGDDP